MTVRFQPIGAAPQLRQRVFKVSSANRFETVVAFLSRKLGTATAAPGGGAAAGAAGGQVFCYVNSVFAPALDEGVGGLWKVCEAPFIVGRDCGAKYRACVCSVSKRMSI